MRMLGQGRVCKGQVRQPQPEGRVWIGEHPLSLFTFVLMKSLCNYWLITGELAWSGPHYECVGWRLSDDRVTRHQGDWSPLIWGGIAGGSWRPACTHHPRSKCFFKTILSIQANSSQFMIHNSKRCTRFRLYTVRLVSISSKLELESFVE